MSATQENISTMLKEGKVSQAELQEAFESSAPSPVTVEGLGVSYSTATGQLSTYCDVISNNSSNPITGLGLVVYSGDGSVMYSLQYSNGLNSTFVSTSVGTTLYNPSMGNQALCVVYGWTNAGSFFFSQTVTIAS